MLVNLIEIATKHRLAGADWRVLGILLTQLGPYNCLAINKAEVAGLLQIQRPNVSRSVKNLVAEGILVETGQKQGRNLVYCLGERYGNPAIEGVSVVESVTGETLAGTELKPQGFVDTCVNS